MFNTTKITTVVVLAATLMSFAATAIPAAAQGRPQSRSFRIERLVISSADWTINDIKIGNRSQFA